MADVRCLLNHDANLVSALGRELSAGQRLLDKDAFRALAGRVKDATGLKGKALFHPIRVVITGAHDGPELDVLIPAIDRAASLSATSGLKPVTGCLERVRAQL